MYTARWCIAGLRYLYYAPGVPLDTAMSRIYYSAVVQQPSVEPRYMYISRRVRFPLTKYEVSGFFAYCIGTTLLAPLPLEGFPSHDTRPRLPCLPALVARAQRQHVDEAPRIGRTVARASSRRTDATHVPLLYVFLVRFHEDERAVSSSCNMIRTSFPYSDLRSVSYLHHGTAAGSTIDFSAGERN